MKIGVIGLGLIGGSIFKDLKKLNYDVIAVSKSQNGENIYKSYEDLKDRDLIFVCSPMNKTLDILDKLENYLTPGTIVTDVCSIKSFVSKKNDLINLFHLIRWLVLNIKDMKTHLKDFSKVLNGL